MEITTYSLLRLYVGWPIFMGSGVVLVVGCPKPGGCQVTGPPHCFPIRLAEVTPSKFRWGQSARKKRLHTYE